VLSNVSSENGGTARPGVAVTRNPGAPFATIAEGIAKAKREGARRKASDLAAWLRTVLHLYSDRVLPFDSPTAEIAGALADLSRGRGHAPGFADIAIAATARRHDLTILSRNERHFAPMDVAVIDPFQEMPTNK
jgi:predicted nucleic acid-binding protein